MGAFLGSCFGSCCATCACSACSCSNASAHSKRARWPYIFLMLGSILLGIVFALYGGTELINKFGLEVSICNSDTCQGNQAIFRISFALFAFFALHALVMFGDCGAHEFHAGFWMFKFVLFGVGLTALFLVPASDLNSVFVVYADIARVISGIFILIEIVLLIDFSYSWNTSWIALEEQNETKWRRGAILAMSVVAYVVAIVLLILQMGWFGGSGCDLQNFVIASTIILTFVHTALAVSSFVEHGALLPSAIVTLFSAYMSYSALASDPSSCNTLTNARDPLELWLGLLLASAAVARSAWKISGSVQGVYGQEDEDEHIPADDDDDANATDTEAQRQERKASAKKDKAAMNEAELAEYQAVRKGNFRFHVIMGMASAYIAMLMTNWGTGDETTTVGSQSMWIKIATGWVANALYIWTLVAPYVLTGRDFG